MRSSSICQDIQISTDSTGKRRVDFGYKRRIYRSAKSGNLSPAIGSIVATSTPTGGQVYVDNQFRGVTPVTIYNVAPGTHIINLQLAGYSDYSTSVDVPANQVVQVSAALVSGSGKPTSTNPRRTFIDINYRCSRYLYSCHVVPDP